MPKEQRQRPCVNRGATLGCEEKLWAADRARTGLATDLLRRARQELEQ